MTDPQLLLVTCQGVPGNLDTLNAATLVNQPLLLISTENVKVSICKLEVHHACSVQKNERKRKLVSYGT